MVREVVPVVPEVVPVILEVFLGVLGVVWMVPGVVWVVPGVVLVGQGAPKSGCFQWGFTKTHNKSKKNKRGETKHKKCRTALENGGGPRI